MKLYIATPINARPEQGFRNKYKAAQKRVRELKEIIKTDHRFYGYSLVSSFDVGWNVYLGKTLTCKESGEPI